ncbi:hypothetical protein [Marinithermus hydrothermalis]|uniref:Phage shock protein G n=1 Tax=Marinithermus hydrothermalis (strain DSM 14884 / JCM 11576 / T1) TaxID=869210 RepID=F2NLD1_MARHT|nr:hypothetical protein [Marinithermus hydrothermalis]AEB11750.1 hypothetical protein Marky_1007 [Marinithermus hydrothermalis DSM 14884]
MGERTLEDVLEWVVLGLLVAVIVLVAFWLGGWVMVFVGRVFLALAAFIVALLKFFVPALIVAGLFYLLVRWLSRPRTA